MLYNEVSLIFTKLSLVWHKTRNMGHMVQIKLSSVLIILEREREKNLLTITPRLGVLIPYCMDHYYDSWTPPPSSYNLLPFLSLDLIYCIGETGRKGREREEMIFSLLLCCRWGGGSRSVEKVNDKILIDFFSFLFCKKEKEKKQTKNFILVSVLH